MAKLHLVLTLPAKICSGLSEQNFQDAFDWKGAECATWLTSLKPSAKGQTASTHLTRGDQN